MDLHGHQYIYIIYTHVDDSFGGSSIAMLSWRVDHNKRLSNFVCKNHDCQKGDQCGTILEVCQMICFSVFLQGCSFSSRN